MSARGIKNYQILLLNKQDNTCHETNGPPHDYVSIPKVYEKMYLQRF